MSISQFFVLLAYEFSKLCCIKNIHINIAAERVDINVLLNRVRADKKKEKLESSIFFGII